MKRDFVITLFLTSLLTACAGINPGSYLSGKANKEFSYQRSQPIYVALSEPQTVKHQEFRDILITEMKQVGLAVSEHLTQDTLVLFFRLNDESTNIVLIPGNPGLTRLPAQWQEIHLELYSIQDIKDPDPVWIGYLKIRINSFKAQPGDSIRPLLELVGRNYEGPTPTAIYTKSEPSPSKEEIERLEEKVKNLEERLEDLQEPSSKPDSGKKSPPGSE